MIRGLGGKIPSAYSQTLNGQCGFNWGFYFCKINLGTSLILIEREIYFSLNIY